MDSKETFENTKQELQNVDTVIDIKHNPVVTAFISSIKKVTFIGDLIDDSLECTLEDLQDKDFMEKIGDKVGMGKEPEEIAKEKRGNELDMDEGMMMAGLSMFENGFKKIIQDKIDYTVLRFLC